MNVTPQFLVCLLVVVASGVAPHEKNFCRNEMSYDTRGCKDYDAWVSCFDDILADPVLTLDDEEIMELTQRLNYYKGLKSQEDRCPALKKKGSCLAQETKKCFGVGFKSVKEQCDKTPDLLSCFVQLNASCSAVSVRKEIGYSNEVMQSCESGQLKKELDAEMESEKCDVEIKGCTADALNLYQNLKQEEAKRKIELANKCLDDVTCGNDDHVEYRRILLEEALDKLSTGLHTGKCTWLALEKCHLIFYYGSDVQPHDQQNYRRCDETYNTKGQECVDDIKEDCQSKEQKNALGKLTSHVKSSCTGKCSWVALGKCHLFFYYGSDVQPHNQHNYRACAPSYITKGKQCVDAIKHDCRTNEQKNALEKLRNHVDNSCSR